MYAHHNTPTPAPPSPPPLLKLVCTELPERIAFCIRLIHVDGFSAPVLTPETIDWLQRQASALDHNTPLVSATSGKA